MHDQLTMTNTGWFETWW